MVGRGEVSDEAWSRIAPLLPPQVTAGRAWRDHRQVINGILWKMRTGAPWRDLPARYGPWKTCQERLRVWTFNGLVGQGPDRGAGRGRGRRSDRVDGLDRLDRVPRAPAFRWSAKKGGCKSARVAALEVDGEAIGRSRGGLTSKVHLAVEERGLPMSFILTPGQDGDNPQLLPLLDAIRVNRPGRGRPRKRPDRVLADKAYAHPSTRRALRRRGISFTSPEKADYRARRLAKGAHGGRPPKFDTGEYANRNSVERYFNRLKQFRDLATRYAKRAAY